MIPGQFDYVRPGSLDETLRILTDREGEAKLLSGGYSLIPLLKLRLAQPALLVDMRDIAGLDGIVETDDGLGSAARVTHRRIRGRRSIKARLPAPPRRGRRDRRPAGPQLGHDRRLRAPTRIPSSDWPAVLLATRATIVCRSSRAARARSSLATSSSTRSRRRSSRPRSSIEVRIPAAAAGSGGAYRKLERRAGDFATVGVAVQVRLGDDGAIAERRHRPDRRRRHAVRRDRRRGGADRRASRREESFRSRRSGRRPEPARQRQPRPGRLQAGDGRRDDRPGPARAVRARHWRSGRTCDEHAAHHRHRQRRGPRGRRRAAPPAGPPPPRRRSC